MLKGRLKKIICGILITGKYSISPQAKAVDNKGVGFQELSDSDSDNIFKTSQKDLRLSGVTQIPFQDARQKIQARSF